MLGEKGYLTLVLHAHLPFVRHPEYEDFLEEDWFYEAITETYLPLLKVFEGLVNDKVDFRLTLSITPTLAAMFADQLLQDRYITHLNKLIELSNKEIERTQYQPEFNQLAHMYNHIFVESRAIFINKYHRNLIEAFKKFQDLGKLEIITCAATHGYLPLMEINKTAVRAQIKIGAEQYKKHFGRTSSGFWLPECGYQPGDDQFLKDEGIRYFLMDTHGILHGSPRPKYGIFAPIYCKSGVAAFGRDIESSKAVWSSVEGYPGDFNYREFYSSANEIKYYRVTGKTNHKKPYVRQWALDKAAEHASNFVFNREKQIEYLHDFMKKKPLVLSPYDAELYGHWWYEGVEWLSFVIRKIYFDQNTIRLITPSEYLNENSTLQVLTPSMSSWGYKGYSEFWLEGANDWIYRYLHKAADRMVELANNYPQAEGILERALNQAARELILAQSSDWAFIMKTGTCVPYAIKRFKDHIGRFTKLYENIKSNSTYEPYLTDLEKRDNLFSDLDYRVYCSSNF